MPIAELRYAQNRRKLDVAARLIDFEARTGTIRELTGLSDSRIRWLSRDCGTDGRRCGRTRHRGASPHSVITLLGKSRARNEAATLVGLCHLMGLLPAQSDHGHGPQGLLRAEKLCDAYWTFRYLLPRATISFEHMMLLLTEAVKAEEMAVTCCSSCKALLVSDALALNSKFCAHCDELDSTHMGMATTTRHRNVADVSANYK